MDIMPNLRCKLGLLVHIDFPDTGFAVQFLRKFVDNGGDDSAWVPHEGAQKSIRTGLFESRTKLLKFSLVISVTAILILLCACAYIFIITYPFFMSI